ncbi:MAG: DEAD/DEAH box helicase family protein [Alloprevotella sp.]|nr:DEAD/DEAH box helicase family protein [Alloprevotella sp.]
MKEDKTRISSYRRVVPMIYAYQTPGYPKHEGWTKIGETENGVERRIRQQVHTAWIDYELMWQDNALFKDGSGEYFSDHDFHDFLQRRKGVERNPGTEWFRIDGPLSQQYFLEFASRRYPKTAVGSSYVLRDQQEEAVRKTLDYMAQSAAQDAGKRKFLWNAKPRFGKTLTAYELIRRMRLRKGKPVMALIVTNRPSIANSWYDDFERFIGWQTGFRFVSDNDALRDRPNVMSRQDFADWLRTPGAHEGFDGQICFESLQGLKGSVYFGGTYNKLEWMKNLHWDLLIIDEAHEGVDTRRTDRAFDNITRDFTLHLSGTPFKAIAGGQFAKDQIFNWSYAEEQEAKEAWDSTDRNPYEDMPRLNLFTYRMSDIVREEVKKGARLDDRDEATEYAFDLNEFFKTEGGKFVYEQDVRKFLRALTTQEKFPFSTDALRTELAHTLWLLNRVDSAKAMARLLKEEGSGFEDYEIVLAAGDGRLEEDSETTKAFNKVKQAIKDHERTITLSVGQLTTGVTIPEWSGVLMLSNMKSPSLYMQAAFRAQNPFSITRDRQRFRKENAYVFDFDPARTLVIFDDFANNLKSETAAAGGTPASREENIRRLLNFFPVIAEDEEGSMVEIDARQVLSIPRSIKAQEVVSRGFLCNFLFKNISNIFSAPGVVQGILEKMDKAHEDRGRSTNATLGEAEGMQVDDGGQAVVPEEIIIGQEQNVFGDKVFENLDALQEECADMVGKGGGDVVQQSITNIKRQVAKTIEESIVRPAAENYGLTRKQAERLAKDLSKGTSDKMDKLYGDYEQQARIADVKRKEALKEADTEQAAKAADEAFQQEMDRAMNDLTSSIKSHIEEVKQEKPREVIERIETDRANKKKSEIEEEVRAHLRGFSRTIPSFIMAYDDGTLRLSNIDRIVTPEVFEEVTGITLEEFRFLRDGGVYTEEGEEKHFDGDLFDEVVFDDSVENFRQKREALANYFDESLSEDIFDYIPPQKTNQIFTPKWVVRKMVDLLEQENPHIFEDPTKTFADLYMKSGLYITEIVRRLYNNSEMRRRIPDDRARILHILRKQVYGFAPTEIIYRIATRYILGFDATIISEQCNFRQVDTVPYAKRGRMEELIEKEFGTIAH